MTDKALELSWSRLSAGTMQAAPAPELIYDILKTRVACTGEEAFAVVYQVMRLTEHDWLHLGSADTFGEAKEIAARDYAQRT